MKKTVYLVGPIGGLSYDDATKWRLDAREHLEDVGFTVLDPMSGKECLKNDKSIGVGLNNTKYVENGYIYHSDLFRLNAADIILSNLTKLSSRPTIGTFFEYGYATAKGKTIITVTTDEYISKHPFIVNSSIIVPTLEDAYDLLSKMGR